MDNNTGNTGTVREETGAIGDRIEGNVKDAYGSVTGDTATEREGEQQAATGDQRQEQNRMLTGLFSDRESTDRAYSSLRDRGYTDDDINLMMSDNTRDSWFTDDETQIPNSAAKHLKVQARVRQSAEHSARSSAVSRLSEQMFCFRD